MPAFQSVIEVPALVTNKFVPQVSLRLLSVVEQFERSEELQVTASTRRHRRHFSDVLQDNETRFDGEHVVSYPSEICFIHVTGVLIFRDGLSKISQ